MYYPLGTEVIYKKRSHALLAVEVFGVENVQSAYVAPNQQKIYWSPFSLGDSTHWRVFIDTPEREKLFTLQAGDKLDIDEGKGKHTVTVTFVNDEAIMIVDFPWEQHWPLSKKHIKKVLTRGDLFFPQPCEINTPISSFNNFLDCVSNHPPLAPTQGMFCFVGDNPTGDFRGNKKKLALYDGNQWCFYKIK
jgi:hypothetical protein